MPYRPHAGVLLAALVLAASAGSALPSLGTAAVPGKLWAIDLDAGEASGIGVNLLGETFVVGTSGGGVGAWKLDDAGRTLWSRRLPGFAAAVTAFPETGAVVATSEWGQGPDIVVQALDAEGGTAWSRTIATPDADVARAAASNLGMVIIAGSTGPDGLLARLDPDGTHRWSRRIATAGEDRLEAVVLLPGDAIAVAGWTYDGIRNRLLLAKLDEWGNTLWQRVLTWEGASLRGHGIAASAAGDLLVAGLRANGLTQAPFAARFDGTGQLLWQRSLDGERGGWASGIAADATGGAILVGASPGSFGQRDTFLARLTPNGATAWTQHYDTGGDDAGRAVAWLPAGVLTLGGSSSGHVMAARFADTPARPLA